MKKEENHFAYIDGANLHIGTISSNQKSILQRQKEKAPDADKPHKGPFRKY